MSEETFSDQNISMFEVPLRACNQGLVVWDENQSLLAWSNKYPDFWHNAAPNLRRGMSKFEWLNHIAQNGGLGEGDPATLAASELKRICSLGPNSIDEFEMRDGRIIRVQRNAMPDGGHVSTYTEITAQRDYEHGLLMAVKAAGDANKAKSAFLASMSHELRTPLNAILGFAQLIKLDTGEPIPEIQSRRLDSILAGGDHLLTLIGDILDLSKIEAGITPLLRDDVSINDVVRDCLDEMAPLIGTAGITVIDKVTSEKIVCVRADQVWLRQAILNYFSNAINYNRRGGSIMIEGKSIDAKFFRLSVSDTGIGIDTEHQPNIFEMFYRATEDAMVTGQGSGIGLSVSKMMVEQMGGRVGFESQKGTGSKFWMEPPLTLA